jgi:prolyl 4-hydroxylase
VPTANHRSVRATKRYPGFLKLVRRILSLFLMSRNGMGLWSNGTTPAWRAGNAGSIPAGSTALFGVRNVELEYLNGRKLFVIPRFLSVEECNAFMERSEQIGYSDAPINSMFGALVRKDVRNNERILLDDPELASRWWQRAKGLLVQEWFGWKAVGFNERFRFYRYEPGQRFAPHTDGCFQRDNGEQSHFTFLVYLNDGFEGGETAFHESRASLHIKPEQGKALVFYHRQLHEGMPVVRGRKYVLRTDVMYRHEAS